MCWKSVKNFPSYQVSSNGHVRSIDRKLPSNGGERFHKGRTLSPGDNGKGYLFVELREGGARKKFYVHRLVALAFIPNPDNLPEVDHIDFDRTNNNEENLRWSSRKENVTHSSSNGRCCYKLSLHDRRRMVERCLTGECPRALSEEFGISLALVYKYVRGSKLQTIRTRKYNQ